MVSSPCIPRGAATMRIGEGSEREKSKRRRGMDVAATATSNETNASSNNNNGGSNNSKKLSAEEMTEGMTPEQLLRLQTQQIKSQDQTLHALSRLSTKLKATSGTIYNEIEEQMEIADDLEKDFKQTQMKMKALRKKGHELNGYRKNEIAEQDRKIRLEAEKEREKEIRAKEASQKGFWGWFNS